MHIALDNVGGHRTPEMLTHAAANELKFYWTPTDASWLNRIEGHFMAMNKFALDNTDPESHDEQQQTIRKYLKWPNRRRKTAGVDWKRAKCHRCAA